MQSPTAAAQAARRLPPFRPHNWLRDGHRQTIGGAYLWRALPYRANRVVVKLSDGDQLILHDDRPPSWQAGDRVAVLIHGLAGCHRSGYMQRIAAKLAARQIRCFRMDMRGCGAGALLARQSMHAGRFEDIVAAIQRIADLAPDSPVTCIGFSLGASMLLKMLGHLGTASPTTVDQAIAVAAPLDLAACSENLSRRSLRLYDRSFVSRLIQSLKSRGHAGVELQAIDWNRRPSTLYEFDAQYTAPMGGFVSVDDYYRSSSCMSELDRIAVPTHVLHAADDPLIPDAVYRAANFSNSTTVYRTEHGGHLGYLSASSTDPDWYWMDWRVVQLVTGDRFAALQI